MAQDLLAREYMEENTTQLLSEECMFWESVRPGASTKVEMYVTPERSKEIVNDAASSYPAPASDIPFDTKVA